MKVRCPDTKCIYTCAYKWPHYAGDNSMPERATYSGNCPPCVPCDDQGNIIGSEEHPIVLHPDGEVISVPCKSVTITMTTSGPLPPRIQIVDADGFAELVAENKRLKEKEANGRVVVCVHCGERLPYRGDATEEDKAAVWAKMVEHEQHCPANPLVARLHQVDDLLAGDFIVAKDGDYHTALTEWLKRIIEIHDDPAVSAVARKREEYRRGLESVVFAIKEVCGMGPDAPNENMAVLIGDALRRKNASIEAMAEKIKQLEDRP